MTEKGKVKKMDYANLINAFGEASRLSISFVAFPVIFLIIGVLLDKKFNTIPLFIVVSIILGMVVFIYQASIVIKKLKSISKLSVKKEK